MVQRFLGATSRPCEVTSDEDGVRRMEEMQELDQLKVFSERNNGGEKTAAA